jgi:hypothetical protein
VRWVRCSDRMYQGLANAHCVGDKLLSVRFVPVGHLNHGCAFESLDHTLEIYGLE